MELCKDIEGKIADDDEEEVRGIAPMLWIRLAANDNEVDPSARR